MNAGVIRNFASETDMDSWVHTLKSMPAITVRQNQCHGVDENNISVFWFQRMIFQKIQALFGEDLLLQFGMFLNETKPWGIHTDAYHVEPFPDRLAATSFLIPYSVNHDKDLVNQSHTIIFNEIGNSNKHTSDLPERTQEASSAMTIFQTHLSHNVSETVKRMTVYQICQWQLGDCIYWDSNLYHDSDNFVANDGPVNKQ